MSFARWQMSCIFVFISWAANTCLAHQFSYSVVSYSLWPHGLQHARLPCPSPTPGACSSSCPLSWWYHPTNSSGTYRYLIEKWALSIAFLNIYHLAYFQSIHSTNISQRVPCAGHWPECRGQKWLWGSVKHLYVCLDATGFPYTKKNVLIKKEIKASLVAKGG